MASSSNSSQTSAALSNLVAGWSSLSLQNLAQQLCHYASPPSSDKADDAVVADRGKVFSTMSLLESSPTPSIQPPLERLVPRRAAVLICLFEGDLGEFRVILTKRSSKLSSYSGQVSLPGGKAEEGDADDQATALREAKEEIGLDPELVTVVAVLEPLITKHPLRVVPVIGILPDKKAFRPVPNIDEVDDVFDAPLEMFLKDENRRSEERESMGVKFLVQYFDYTAEDKKFLIWGLTASILIRAASVVYQRPPSFSTLFPKFKISS